MDAHPIADRFPMMSEADFAALVADIRTNGLHEPIVMFEGRILDGRHRFRACQLLNIMPSFELFDGDARAARRLADSLNIHRRHLNGKTRRELIVSELKRDPSQSDRSIAKKTNVHQTTVGNTRAEMEKRGEVSKLDTRLGSDGKSQSATKRVSARGESYKPYADRVAQLKELATAGNSISQIAEAAGIGPERVSALLRASGIKLSIPKASTHAANALRVATETVNVLMGTAQGLEIFRRAGLTLSKTNAAELLPDLREAMKSLRWFEQQLKGVANG
jgi:ParB-like chromosome segregation protein Spo0J